MRWPLILREIVFEAVSKGRDALGISVRGNADEAFVIAAHEPRPAVPESEDSAEEAMEVLLR